MKKYLLIAALIFGCFSFKAADAQVAVRFGLNIGSQPDWGPVGYSHARYYYIPDIDAYYDISAHQYVYYENNAWVHRATLPPRYGNWDRYHSYKVVINRRDPWRRNREIRARYSHYKGRHDQAVLRDRHEHDRNHRRAERHHGRH